MALSKNKKLPVYVVGMVFLIFCIILGTSQGSVTVPFGTTMKILWQALWAGDYANLDDSFVTIVLQVRLPRVLLAALVGASLSIAGAAFQGLLKNPLADPYTIGVSSGSAVGAVSVLFFGWSLPVIGTFTLPFISILSGFLTLLLLLAFVRFIEQSLATETIILAGIIVSSFLSAVISLIITFTGEELRQIISWLMGSVAMRGWDYVWLMLPFFIIGSLLLLANRSELNALVFGEETAKTLGVNTGKRRFMILAGASLLTGSAVASSGTIAFVGLVIPHLMRLLFGPDHRHLLPLSMCAGGGFLILTDLGARTFIAPAEFPIGVITSIIGAPIFGILLYQQKRRRAIIQRVRR
ncbi:FecCD family ABC transporter permease [Bacillus piscicola]|uniref:FecCD family ABC transporter permease n=1 Tax=Bacillus piscicola TaxID=1632684 RepID=UPI001F094452|nr:iron ABC transporter permease [Bacillus piscicola]